MTKAKMTKKDKFAHIIDALATANIDATLKADLTDFCNAEIDSLDKKAAKAKDKAAAKKATIDNLTSAVLDALDTFDEPATINALVDAVKADFPDVTNAKISSRLSPLVKTGEVIKTEITVAREKGKAKLMAYSKVVNND